MSQLGRRVQGKDQYKVFRISQNPREALKLVVDQTNAIGLKGNQMFKNPCVLEIFPIIFEVMVSIQVVRDWTRTWYIATKTDTYQCFGMLLTIKTLLQNKNRPYQSYMTTPIVEHVYLCNYKMSVIQRVRARSSKINTS